MPRTTRAAARAQETDTSPQLIFEDDSTATATERSSQTTPVPARPIFGELTGNNIPAPEPKEQTVTIYAMPAKKVRDKKGRPANQKTKLALEVQTGNDNQMTAEVLEDENQSDSSDAAEAAAEELRKPETFQVPMDFEGSRSPLSAAAQEATSSLLRSPNKDMVAMQGMPPNTPKFNPAVHREELLAGEDNKEDSFVEDITTRSPVKARPQIEEHREDSFIEAIITRSPVKVTPRIEDSVAEMDALDDAIEKVAEILPVLEERDLESPVATRKVIKEAAIPSPKRGTALTTTLATPPAAKAPKVRPSLNKPSARPSTSRPSTVRVKPTARASVLPIQRRAVSTDNSSSSLDRQGMSFSASPVKAQSNIIQKTRKSSATTSLSTSKPGFVPTKSTKAATTSTFTLPGEVIAAKLRTQREERQKREEEAPGKQAGKNTVAKSTVIAKARTRLSTAVAPAIKPRETKTSQARQSLMAANNETRIASGGSNKKKGAPSKATARQSTKSPPVKAMELSVRKKPSSIGAGATSNVQKTRTPMKVAETSGAESGRANSNIQRTSMTIVTKAAQKDSMAPSPSSGSDAGAKKLPMSKADLVSQKGKEVFGRDKIQKVAADRARREKEEAAKKARADAAERGRVASREWAEKQKKKAGAAEAANKDQVPVVGGGGVAVEAAGV